MQRLEKVFLLIWENKRQNIFCYILTCIENCKLFPTSILYRIKFVVYKNLGYTLLDVNSWQGTLRFHSPRYEYYTYIYIL